MLLYKKQQILTFCSGVTIPLKYYFGNMINANTNTCFWFW